MEPQSLFHIAIKVEDPDRAAEFYRTHLAAETVETRRIDVVEEEPPAEAVVLQVADKRVYLFDRPPYEVAGLVDELPYGFLHFGYIVDDIDANFEALRAAGVEIIMEPTDSGGKTIGFFRGPGDIRIELLEIHE